jgi:shikimate kinase
MRDLEERSGEMRDLEEIRRDIADCDNRLLEQLVHRMNCINEVITYKKIHGIPILQPEQEEKQAKRLRALLNGNMYEDEILEIFAGIREKSRRVQARALVPGNIALIGFMGTGKTSVGAMLKDLMAMDSVESDDRIVEKAGMSINEIFEKYGEEYFRDLESEVLESCENLRQTVISCGGGAVLRRRNVDSLKKHSRIVLLTASPQTILDRIGDSDDRPKLRGKKNVKAIAEMMAEREQYYRDAADVVVDTDRKTVLEVCEEIIALPEGREI